MSEEWTLFEMKDSYSLIGLKDLCLKEIKSQMTPVDGEDMDEYLKNVQDEADLLFAERLKIIAEGIEKRILEPQSQVIRETYEGIFNKNK